jgi:hypothetical protein
VSVARCEERALHTLRPGIDPFESALASFYISSNPLLYPLPIALGVLRARKSLSLYSEVPGGLPRTFDSMNSVTPDLIAFDSRWRSPLDPERKILCHWDQGEGADREFFATESA